jgi:hypothetical protein
VVLPPRLTFAIPELLMGTLANGGDVGIQSHVISCTLTLVAPGRFGLYVLAMAQVNCTGDVVETGVYGYLTNNGVAQTVIYLNICPGSPTCSVVVSAAVVAWPMALEGKGLRKGYRWTEGVDFLPLGTGSRPASTYSRG